MSPAAKPATPVVQRYVVQGTSTKAVTEAVIRAGGEITHELGVIRAVGARATEWRRLSLSSVTGITYPDERQINTLR